MQYPVAAACWNAMLIKFISKTDQYSWGCYCHSFLAMGSTGVCSWRREDNEVTVLSQNSIVLGHRMICHRGTKHSPHFTLFLGWHSLMRPRAGGRDLVCHRIVCFLKGNGAYPPEKLITEETANMCSKTWCEQDSPEPGFCGVKIAAKGEFETWLLKCFLWVGKKEARYQGWVLALKLEPLQYFPLGNVPISRK